MTTYENCAIKVPILGEEWTVRIVSEASDPRFKKLNCDGFCDWSTKEMIVNNGDPKEAWSIGDPKNNILHSIKHELVHAYMFASGLAGDWEHKNEFGQEETVVDWVAWQMEKMADTMKFIKAQLKEREMDEV